jgi:outer membrane protein
MRNPGRAVWALLLVAGSSGSSLIAGAQGPTPATGPTKIAYVRSQDIFAVAPGRNEAEAQFNKEVEAARAQAKVMNDSNNTMLTDYAKVEGTLTADQRLTRQQAIRDKQLQFQQRQQQLDQQVQQRQQELVAPILQLINKIINDIRNENNYSIIFDAQAQGGGVVAADKTLDITDQVIVRLKAAGAPAAAAPAKPLTGPTSTPSGVSRPKTSP